MAYPNELEPTAALEEIFDWLAARAREHCDTHIFLAGNVDHPSNQGRGKHLAAHLEGHRAAAKINRIRVAGWRSRARKTMPASPETPAAGFWMYETTGVLRPIVVAILKRAPLTPEQIPPMRAYLRQWINDPAWVGEALSSLRDGIDELTTSEAIYAWLEAALDEGIDPL